MEFVTLGTAGGPVPLKHRAQPAHAVISGERTILVDCGDGAMGQLMKAGPRLELHSMSDVATAAG